MAPLNYAALDLGTNTFRLLIARPEPAAPLGYAPLHVERVITRAGDGFSSERGIGAEALARALACLESFRNSMQSFGVAAYRAAATSVFRRAANSAAVLKTIREATGLEVEVIAGSEEAGLSALGAVSQVKAPGAAVVFDIGGGSTEFIVWLDGAVASRHSFEFGVVQLSEDLLHSDPPSEAEIMALRSRVAPLIQKAAAQAKSALGTRAFTLVGTAGTVSTLGAIDLELPVYDREKINGHRLQKTFVDENLARFAKMTKTERLRVPGLEAGREDLIVPGCVIAGETMAALGVRDLLVSEGGLLEGVLFDLMDRAGARRFLS